MKWAGCNIHPVDSKNIYVGIRDSKFRKGNGILFRGGILDMGDSYWLYNEDGASENSGMVYVFGDGIKRVNTIEPSEWEILGRYIGWIAIRRSVSGVLIARPLICCLLKRGLCLLR